MKNQKITMRREYLISRVKKEGKLVEINCGYLQLNLYQMKLRFESIRVRFTKSKMENKIQ